MTRDEEIETFIINAFEQNFEMLKLESGHSLAAAVKQTALNQALLYWIKLEGSGRTHHRNGSAPEFTWQYNSTRPQVRHRRRSGYCACRRKVVMYDIKDP